MTPPEVVTEDVAVSLWDVLAMNALALVLLMSATWAISLWKKDASIVDIVWGLGFVVVAWLTYGAILPSEHGLLLCALVTLWAGRLSGHILVRNWGRGEDVRYVRLREKYAPFWWKSFFVVFMLQGALLFVVSLPLQLGQTGPLAWTDVVGAVLFAIGLGIEGVADAQLALFKGRKARKEIARDAIMDTGLWGWSRHPNYFGEMIVWWGIAIVAVPAFVPSSLVALLSPITITFLLMRVSGVPMLEAAMKDRPGYAEYVARVPAFFPRPPRA
jgi:steroid 5-alpha reductase family enzyme